MPRTSRHLILAVGAFALLALLFVVRRLGRNSVECVDSRVTFEVDATGLEEPGSELVINTTPGDPHNSGPIRVPLANGVSKEAVFFSPYSIEKVDCSRKLETVELVVEHNGHVEGNARLTYPQDFYLDQSGGYGSYIAKKPVTLGK